MQFVSAKDGAEKGEKRRNPKKKKSCASFCYEKGTIVARPA